MSAHGKGDVSSWKINNNLVLRILNLTTVVAELIVNIRKVHL